MYFGIKWENNNNNDNLSVELSKYYTNNYVWYNPVSSDIYSKASNSRYSSIVWSDDSANDNGDLDSKQWFDAWSVRWLENGTTITFGE